MGIQLNLNGVSMEQEIKPPAKRGRRRNGDRMDRGDERIDTWVDKAFAQWFESIRKARGGNKQDLAREALRRGLRSLAKELDDAAQGGFPFVAAGVGASSREDLAEPTQPQPAALREKFKDDETPRPRPPAIPALVREMYKGHQSTSTSSPAAVASLDTHNDEIASIRAAEKVGRKMIKDIFNALDRDIPSEPNAEQYRVAWMHLAEVGIDRSDALAGMIEGAIAAGWRLGRLDLMHETQKPSGPSKAALAKGGLASVPATPALVVLSGDVLTSIIHAARTAGRTAQQKHAFSTAAPSEELLEQCQRAHVDELHAQLPVGCGFAPSSLVQIKAQFTEGWREMYAAMEKELADHGAKKKKLPSREAVAKHWIRRGYDAACSAKKKTAHMTAKPMAEHVAPHVDDMHALPDDLHKVAYSAFEQGWWKRYAESEGGAATVLAKPANTKEAPKAPTPTTRARASATGPLVPVPTKKKTKSAGEILAKAERDRKKGKRK